MDQLRKRSEVLGVAQEIVAENRDAVLSCAVAKAVFKTAREAVPTAAFAASLLPVALDFDFARDDDDTAVVKDIRE